MSKGFKVDTTSNFFKGITDNVHNQNSPSIKDIDISLIVPSDRNFFELRDIEILANDIKANGLYHNLVVRSLDDGKYELISGERRFEALKILKYEKVPCLIKNDVSDIDSEIMLIQANKNTRELTEIEKATMVGRLEELYKQKKANGEKIEGRLRDKIGEDMGLSGVQVQRYKKINENLIHELKELLERKEIIFRDAFDFSKMSKEDQKGIYEFLIDNIDANIKASKNAIENLKKEITKKDSLIIEKDNSNKELNKTVDKLKEEVNSVTTVTTIAEIDVENFKFNTELNVLLNNMENIISDFNKYRENISNASSENKDKIKEIKKSISETLDTMSKIDK